MYLVDIPEPVPNSIIVLGRKKFTKRKTIYQPFLYALTNAQLIDEGGVIENKRKMAISHILQML